MHRSETSDECKVSDNDPHWDLLCFYCEILSQSDFHFCVFCLCANFAKIKSRNESKKYFALFPARYDLKTDKQMMQISANEKTKARATRNFHKAC